MYHWDDVPGMIEGHAGETVSLSWPGNIAASSQKIKMGSRRCLRYCPSDPTKDKQKKMDGCVNCKNAPVKNICLFIMQCLNIQSYTLLDVRSLWREAKLE